MGVNEDTLLDNQVRCVVCGQVHDAQVATECEMCESPLCPDISRLEWSECHRNHLEAEFTGWDQARDPYQPDAKFLVACWHTSGPDKSHVVIVRNPHYEPDSDDEGMTINSYTDEGWFFESGEELSKDQKDEIEDWIRDLVQDALRKR